MASLMSRSPRRDRVVAGYLRRELYPHTEAGRARIDAAPITGGRVRSLAELRAIAPVELADVGDGREYLVQPTRRDLLRHGKPTMRLRTAWASTWGRWDAYVAAIEPRYRPVHFFTADHVPVGAAAADLVRLAGLGAHWLAALGVGSHDRIALVGGLSAAIEPWQLSGGTRRAGISLAVLDDPAGAARHAVSVVAGSEDAVAAALSNGVWPGLRIALVLGDSRDDVDRRLAKLGATNDVAVRHAWAPPGTRSVWFECRGGHAHGWHTTPAAEFVEIDDHDEVLWTGLGWAGTVFLRLRTDLRAAQLLEGACGACGVAGVRLMPAPGRPALARWLSGDSRVADFRLTGEGADVLPTRAGANARLGKDAASAFAGQTLAIKTKRAWAAES
ncbi:MAG TPA: hypothetical protein VMZ22_00340 [Acidimicrobiales bacterium]|nr:hypothetical protein [Acidimicrobiales bacterium]